jgi:hypothetical protein
MRFFGCRHPHPLAMSYHVMTVGRRRKGRGLASNFIYTYCKNAETMQRNPTAYKPTASSSFLGRDHIQENLKVVLHIEM